MGVNSMPVKERPVNRVWDVGPTALASAELIAILIGGDNSLAIAQNILSEYGSLPALCKAEEAEIRSFDGIGAVTAARLKAAFELGRRMLSLRYEDRPQVRAPADVLPLVSDMHFLDKEELRVVVLDSKNYVMAIETIYVGNVNTAIVRVGEVLRPAVIRNAIAMIVVHNHPSGDPIPSPEDVIITRKIVRSGELFDVEVIDHIVVGSSGRWISLKERGLGFGNLD